MSLDAVIISNFGTESLSGSHGQRLTIDGEIADIQTVLHLLKNGPLNSTLKESNSDCWSCAPTLNGIALYSSLAGQGFSVALVNNFYTDNLLFQSLLAEKPKAIILSTTFILSARHLSQAVAEVRKHAPNMLIVAGGPFVYQSSLILQRSTEPLYGSPELKKQYLFMNDEIPAVDCFVISRQGDTELGQILKSLPGMDSLDKIPNLAIPGPSGYQFTNQKTIPSQLADGSIDWDRLPDSVFESGVISLQGSFGCPYNCAFCNFPKDSTTNRAKALDQIINEMKSVARRGIRYVWFVDDNFMLGKNNLNPVFERMIAEDLHLEWMSLFRADALRHVDHALMRKAGCREVCLGLESADLQILKNMNKRATPEMYEEVIQKLLAAGINCSCYFVVGFPGENSQTIERTHQFIKRISALESPGNAQWSLYPFYLAPLSPVFEEDARAQFGLTGGWDEWSHTTMTVQEARLAVKQIFKDIPGGGTIYRSDNQDMLDLLTPQKRKQFFSLRHNLAVRSQHEPLSAAQVLNEFKAALIPG